MTLRRGRRRRRRPRDYAISRLDCDVTPAPAAEAAYRRYGDVSYTPIVPRAETIRIAGQT